MGEPRVLSASQVDSYRMCSLKWHYRYVEHAPQTQRGSALVVGISVDVALKHALMDLKDGVVSIEQQDPLPYITRAWDEELASTDVPINWGKAGQEKAAATARALVKRFLDREDLVAYVQAIEAADVAFELPVVDPDTGRDTGVALRGIMDLVVRDEDVLKVLDLKTSASRASWGPSDLWQHLQGAVYAWALRHLHGDDASEDVLFDVGFKLKEPIWERRSVILGEGAQRRAIKTVLATARAMDLDVAFPTPGWSCPTCPYAQRCTGWQAAPATPQPVDIFAA